MNIIRSNSNPNPFYTVGVRCIINNFLGPENLRLNELSKSLRDDIPKDEITLNQLTVRYKFKHMNVRQLKELLTSLTINLQACEVKKCSFLTKGLCHLLYASEGAESLAERLESSVTFSLKKITNIYLAFKYLEEQLRKDQRLFDMMLAKTTTGNYHTFDSLSAFSTIGPSPIIKVADESVIATTNAVRFLCRSSNPITSERVRNRTKPCHFSKLRFKNLVHGPQAAISIIRFPDMYAEIILTHAKHMHYFESLPRYGGSFITQLLDQPAYYGDAAIMVIDAFLLDGCTEVIMPPLVSSFYLPHAVRSDHYSLLRANGFPVHLLTSHSTAHFAEIIKKIPTDFLRQMLHKNLPETITRCAERLLAEKIYSDIIRLFKQNVREKGSAIPDTTIRDLIDKCTLATYHMAPGELNGLGPVNGQYRPFAFKPQELREMVIKFEQEHKEIDNISERLKTDQEYEEAIKANARKFEAIAQAEFAKRREINAAEVKDHKDHKA